MLQSNLDNLVARQISSNWCILTSLANNVGFIGFCSNTLGSAHILGILAVEREDEILTLPVHAKSVLITANPLAPCCCIVNTAVWYLKTATVCRESSCAYTIDRVSTCIISTILQTIDAVLGSRKLTVRKI